MTQRAMVLVRGQDHERAHPGKRDRGQDGDRGLRGTRRQHELEQGDRVTQPRLERAEWAVPSAHDQRRALCKQEAHRCTEESTAPAA